MVTTRRHRIPWLAMVDTGAAVPGLEAFLCSYVLLAETAAVVDIGPTCCVPGVLAGLERLGVGRERVRFLITSHIHLDHGGGTGTALGSLPNAVAVVHPSGLGHMERPWKLWEASARTLTGLAQAYGRPEPVPAHRLVAASHGMKLDLGDLELEVVFTPGHAPHHLSLFEPGSRTLLAGELCGVRARGISRPATPPPLYLDQELDSLDRAIALRPSVMCYGHYGWTGRAEERLRAHRRQLLSWKDTVAAALQAGLTPEEIEASLVVSDRGLARMGDLTPLQRKREDRFILNSVAGLTGHIERETAHGEGAASRPASGLPQL